jgi:hypothetical protein
VGRLATLVVLGLALVVRVAVAPSVRPVAERAEAGAPGDDAEYLLLAEGLLDRGEFADGEDDYLGLPLSPPQRAWRAPGFAFALAGHFALFGRGSGALLNLGLGVLLCGIAMALAGCLGGPRAGLAAGLAAALCPSLVLWSNLLFAETLLAVLVAGGLALWLFSERRTAAALAGGLLLGSAVLTRPSVLFVPLALAVVEAARSADFRRSLARLGFLAVGFSAAVLPWAIRNHHVLDRWLLATSTGGNLLGAVSSPDGGFCLAAWRDLHADIPPDRYPDYEVRRNDEGLRRAWALLAGDPSRLLRQVPRRFASLFGRDDQCAYWAFERGAPGANVSARGARGVLNAAWLALLWLACGAALARAARREGGRLLMPGAVAAAVTAVHLVFESQDRYHVVLTPVLIVAAAVLLFGDRPSLAADPRGPAEGMAR